MAGIGRERRVTTQTVTQRPRPQGTRGPGPGQGIVRFGLPRWHGHPHSAQSDSKILASMVHFPQLQLGVRREKIYPKRLMSEMAIFRQSTLEELDILLRRRSWFFSFGIVLWVHPLKHKRPHAMKLNSSSTPTRNEVMHLFWHRGERAGRHLRHC